MLPVVTRCNSTFLWYGGPIFVNPPTLELVVSADCFDEQRLKCIVYYCFGVILFVVVLLKVLQNNQEDPESHKHKEQRMIFVVCHHNNMQQFFFVQTRGVESRLGVLVLILASIPNNLCKFWFLCLRMPLHVTAVCGIDTNRKFHLIFSSNTLIIIITRTGDWNQNIVDA
jgi:hypothetical protein